MIKLQIITRGDVKGPWLENEADFAAALAAITDEARAAGKLQLIEPRPKVNT